MFRRHQIADYSFRQNAAPFRTLEVGLLELEHFLVTKTEEE